MRVYCLTFLTIIYQKTKIVLHINTQKYLIHSLLINEVY